jgi:hypothetical protein
VVDGSSERRSEDSKTSPLIWTSTVCAGFTSVFELPCGMPLACYGQLTLGLKSANIPAGLGFQIQACMR